MGRCKEHPSGVFANVIIEVGFESRDLRQAAVMKWHSIGCSKHPSCGFDSHRPHEGKVRLCTQAVRWFDSTLSRVAPCDERATRVRWLPRLSALEVHVEERVVGNDEDVGSNPIESSKD